MIKVSFVVIGYNIEKYIEKCIGSIMNQSLRNIEIIFVDDGSTDNTLSIIKNLEINDNRIQIVSQNNSGANHARKKGYTYANGKYVIFVDGDDWVDEKLAEDIYTIAEKHNSDIVCFKHYYSYDNGKSVVDKKSHYDNINKFKYLELILSEKIAHEFWNKMYKNSFLKKCEFYNIPDITMGDDLAANVMFGINEPEVNMTSKAYYFYNIRGGSITQKSSIKTLEIVSCLQWIEELLKSKNLFKKYKEEIDHLWFYHCYFLRVLGAPCYTNNVEKELYEVWKSKRIKLKDNYYYKEFIERNSLEIRIRKIIFDFNYNLGIVYLHIKRIIKNSKNLFST